MLVPGKVFGEVELIDGKPRTSTARASDTVRITMFTHDEIVDMLFQHPENSLILARDVFNHLRKLYGGDDLESTMEKLREEMHEKIKKAVIAHESRVVKSHNGMAAIAIPIVLLVITAISLQLVLH